MIDASLQNFSRHNVEERHDQKVHVTHPPTFGPTHMPQPSTMSRKDRLELLCDLVQTHDYRTQSELIDALASNQIHLTQSSMSRDIKSLNLSKVDGVYTLPLTATLAMPSFDGPVWHHILAMHCVGEHLVVLRVQAATAQLVGSALDSLPLPGVVGTISGDDTLFIACKEHVHQEALTTQLRKTVGLD